ncbi:MAG: NAD-dependent epimerase/dehydratase family protein [Gammaproteobacteria bacterium]
MIFLNNKVEENPTRVLIFGGNGFVGGDLKKELFARSIPTISLSMSNFKEINFVLEDNDCIVFSSAISPCKKYCDFIENIEKFESILNLLEKNSRKINQFIYLSSEAVYGDYFGLISENSDPNPDSLYGIMHFTKELLLKTKLSEKKSLILRPSMVYGALDPHNAYGPNRFLRELNRSKEINLVGSGEEIRDYIYISDLSNLIVKLILNKAYGVLNCGSGFSYSFLEVIKIIEELHGPFSVNFIERSRKITKREIDNSRLKLLFPDFNFLNLKEGLKRIKNNERS